MIVRPRSRSFILEATGIHACVFKLGKDVSGWVPKKQTLRFVSKWFVQECSWKGVGEAGKGRAGGQARFSDKSPEAVSSSTELEARELSFTDTG